MDAQTTVWQAMTPTEPLSSVAPCSSTQPGHTLHSSLSQSDTPGTHLRLPEDPPELLLPDLMAPRPPARPAAPPLPRAHLPLSGVQPSGCTALTAVDRMPNPWCRLFQSPHDSAGTSDQPLAVLAVWEGLPPWLEQWRCCTTAAGVPPPAWKEGWRCSGGRTVAAGEARWEAGV